MEAIDRVEAKLAFALLAAVALTAALESRSRLAGAIRRRAPVMAWVDASAEGRVIRHAALYQPGRRTLDMIYLPDASARQRLLAAARGAGLDVSGAPAIALRVGRVAEDPALTVPDWFAAAGRGPAFWRGLTRLLGASGARATSLSWIDRVVAAREARRLRPESFQPAWLPGDEAQIGQLLGAMIAPEQPDHASVVTTAEVLNASDRKGVASEATKVLRSGDVDVVYFGNTAPRERTVAYDRTGRFGRARAVAALLGCPEARAVTQVQRQSQVDVSVVIGSDCRIVEKEQSHGTR